MKSEIQIMMCVTAVLMTAACNNLPESSGKSRPRVASDKDFVIDLGGEYYSAINGKLDCKFGIISSMVGGPGAAMVDVAGNNNPKRANTARSECKAHGFEPGF